MSARTVGLRTQILAVVLGVAILPLALLAVWLTTSGVRSGERLLRDHLQASADRYAAVVNERWEYRQGDISLLAGNAATLRAVTRDSLDANDRHFLDNLADDLSQTIPSIEIRDVADRVRWSSSSRSRSSLRSEAGAVATPAQAVPVIQLHRPVLDESGVRIGQVTVEISIAALAPADSARPLVTGAQAAVRIHPTQVMLVPLRPAARYPVGERAVIGGVDWLVVHRTLDGPGLDIAIGAPLGPYVAPFKSATRVGIAALVAVFIIALIAALLLTARMTRPLEELATASEAVTQGNLDRRTSPSGPTEVRRVGTAFNAMTENLRTTLDELSRRSALAAVGEFATSLSHDMRNALTSVRLDLERAERMRIDEPAPRKLLERALGSVTRLETLLNGALQVARAGRIPAAEVDVSGPIREAADAVMGTLGAISGSLEIDLADDALIVRGSAAGLQQVFANLLFNAANALQPGGRILVAGRSRDEMVEVLIADNGCGFSEEMLAPVSGPFVSSKPNGSGLGLPIARRIVAEHGGTLEIESATGEGTVVRVRLPRLNESSSDVERSVALPARQHSTGPALKT
jgi:signal transduction histidine kinase